MKRHSKSNGTMKLHIILNSIELVSLVFRFEITINRRAEGKKAHTHTQSCSTQKFHKANPEYVHQFKCCFSPDSRCEWRGNYKKCFIFRLSFLAIMPKFVGIKKIYRFFAIEPKNFSIIFTIVFIFSLLLLLFGFFINLRLPHFFFSSQEFDYRAFACDKEIPWNNHHYKHLIRDNKITINMNWKE